MPSTTAIALTAQVSADTWHRRLGRMNPRSMELLRKTGNNGVDYTGTVSGCDICLSSKSRQEARPMESLHTTTGPTELVYTDLMGPITPVARVGYKYVAKFTDDYSRMKEIFLLETKQEAAESIISTIWRSPLLWAYASNDCGPTREASASPSSAGSSASTLESPWSTRQRPRPNRTECRNGLDRR
ncbi:unnamed protein product [Laminaria digitata]